MIQCKCGAGNLHGNYLYFMAEETPEVETEETEEETEE
jgi:hypothetical protein